MKTKAFEQSEMYIIQTHTQKIDDGENKTNKLRIIHKMLIEYVTHITPSLV